MAQSDIQSLLQQATGLQTTGQSWLPSSVNNGNPNTVYNVTPAEGGYIPPTTDGQGNWMINKPGVSTVPDWSKLVKDPDQVGQNFKPVWDLSTSVPPPIAGTPAPAPGTPAPGTPVPAPPPAAPQYVAVGNWFGSGQKDGGRSGPLSNQDLVKNNPAAKQAWDTVFSFHKVKFDKTSDWAAVQRHLEDEYKKAIAQGVPTSGPTNTTATAGGGSNAAGGSGGGAKVIGTGGTILGFGGAGTGTQSATGGAKGGTSGTGGWGWGSGGGNYGGASTLYNAAPEIANKLGINPNGSIAWQQLADYLIPGNAYLSKSGEWDASNVVTALMGEITGLPIDSILTKLGEMQAGQDDPQNFIERMLIDHYMDKLNNSLAGQLNMSQAQFQQQIAPLISQSIADSVDIASLDIQNDSINDLLEKAEKKMQEKLANKTASSGGGGGGGEGRGGGGGARGGYFGGDVSVQVRDRGSGAAGNRGSSNPGTVTVGEVKKTSGK